MHVPEKRDSLGIWGPQEVQDAGWQGGVQAGADLGGGGVAEAASLT